MTYIPLIDPTTGEIDTNEIVRRAPRRAEHEYGGTNYPPRYLREALEWLRERARSERLQWRDARGLPREEAGVLVDISGWTDTFRRVT